MDAQQMQLRRLFENQRILQLFTHLGRQNHKSGNVLGFGFLLLHQLDAKLEGPLVLVHLLLLRLVHPPELLRHILVPHLQ